MEAIRMTNVNPELSTDLICIFMDQLVTWAFTEVCK